MLPKQFRWGDWQLTWGHGLLGLESLRSDLLVIVPHYRGSLWLRQGPSARCLFADGSWVEVPCLCLPHLPAQPQLVESLPEPDPADVLTWEVSSSRFLVVQPLSGLGLEVERYGGRVRLQHPRRGEEFLGAQEQPPQEEPKTSPWIESIAEESARRVLLHLDKFASVTEEEVADMTGGPRQARAFAGKLDQYRPLLPFVVEVDSQLGQKIYRKR